MAVRREVMAPNGFLHAASVIALADTSCGYGCVAALPGGREGLHHHRAEEQLPRHRARRLHCLPRHAGPPGPHHPGLGRGGHESRQPGRRSPSSGAPRWFCGRIRNRDAPVLLRFLLLSQPSGGRDRLSSPKQNPENRQPESLAVFFCLRPPAMNEPIDRQDLAHRRRAHREHRPAAAAGAPDPLFPDPGHAGRGADRRDAPRVREILHGQSDRLLVVIGPCSIHDPAAAIAYAEKLSLERQKATPTSSRS